MKPLQCDQTKGRQEAKTTSGLCFPCPYWKQRFLIAFLLLVPSISMAQPAYLVEDINTNSEDSYPSSVTHSNGIALFMAYDPQHGRELWRSDGTPAGTYLVKDIRPGPNGSDPDNFVDVGGILYFRASDGVHGLELWKSDGTETGTILVKDIVAGTSDPWHLNNINGILFFRANDSVNGYELWKSDGTEAGTFLVKDINPGLATSDPYYLTNVNGTLFFRAWSPSIGYELWKSDGTAAGTVLVKDINPGPAQSDPYYLTNVNGTLFFTANDGSGGTELWKSDGTEAGTVLVKDIFPGTGYRGPESLSNVNGTLFFRAYSATSGYELWKSDGTAAGTVLVKDIFPGTGDSSPESLINVNGSLFFLANDGTNGYRLWKSDGTEGGTINVSGSGAGAPGNLTNVEGTLFFSASDLTNGREIWKSDGTESGTVRVKDIVAGLGSGQPEFLTNINGTLFFSAYDPINGRELWKSDGTEAGTVLVKDINTRTLPSYPQNFAQLNGELYYAASDPLNGLELWKSDGTPGGTSLVKDIYPGPNGSSISYMTEVGGTLFFRATDADNNYELWKSDGTAAGTVLVKDIYPGSNSWPEYLTNVNGMLFFRAYDPANGYELWKSDGTEAGTVLVKNIVSGSGEGNPVNLINFDGTLFFSAYDPDNGRELWKSDGTEVGTVLVKNIVSGSGSSQPEILTHVNGTLFFNAFDPDHGRELWKSDGTEAGTVLVKDIFSGTGYSNPQLLTNVNGTLFFRAYDPANGYELWKSDGTEAGTVLVKDIFPGSNSGNPSNFHVSGGMLFFSANDGTTGTELWKSDGTAEGTQLVQDIWPGSSSSNPGIFKAIGDSLFFSASNEETASELWWIPDVGVLNTTFSVSPTNLDFQDALAGTADPEVLSMTLTNNTNHSVILVGPGYSISGADSSEFAVWDNPSSAPLPSGSTRVIEVAFLPTSPGSKSATLMITSDDPLHPLLQVTLSGSAGAYQALAAPEPEASGLFGRSIAGIEDVDGGGSGDLVIGAMSVTAGGFSGSGKVYLVSGEDGSLIRILESPTPETGGRFGMSVAVASDANGNGYDDILVSAPLEDPGSSPSDSGRVHLFDGFTGTLLRTLVSPNEETNGQFGFAVSGIPDVNNDGRGEVLVGAHSESPGASPSEAGRAYIFDGSTGTLLRTLASPNEVSTGHFGWSVSGLSDVNGDGHGDVLIGAPDETAGGHGNGGHAYIFSGATGGLLNTLTSPNVEEAGNFGASVSRVPDINGDGIDDVVAGAFADDPGSAPTDAGRAYVFSGSSGSVLRTLISPDEENSGYFGVHVVGITDTNGDGLGEVLVGSYEDPGGSPEQAGRAHLFDGAGGGVLRTFASPNEEATGRFGAAMSGIPDINGDSYPEIAITAHNEDGTYVNEGAVYLFLSDLPRIAASPISVDFGSQDVDDGSAIPTDIVLDNAGEGYLTFSGGGITLTGPDISEFSILNSPSTSRLAPGATREVVISFDPTSLGVKSATLEVTTNDPIDPVLEVPLRGTGGPLTTISILSDLAYPSGNPYTIEVNLSDAEDLLAITNLIVSFDPSVLSPVGPVGVQPGNLISDWVVVANTNTPGEIRISATGVAPVDVPPASGSITLFSLEFNVVGGPAACTTLDVETVLLEDSVGDEITTVLDDGHFCVAAEGTIEVEVEPNSATWTLTGPSGFTSVNGSGDQTITGAPAGTYLLTCNPLANHITPAPISGDLEASSTLVLHRDYIPIGTVEVAVDPNAGSWTLEGPGGFGTQGGTGDQLFTGVPMGAYSLTFQDLADYIEPATQNGNLFNPGDTLTLSGLFIPSGTVEVEVDPDAGSWTLTGPSGFETQVGTGDQAFLNSPAGAYSLTFQHLANYIEPATQNGNLVNPGDTLTLSGHFIPSGTVEVEVDPDEGSWTLTGPNGFGTQVGTGDQAFLNSPAGAFSLTFQDLANYIEPATQNGNLVNPGDTLTLSGIFIPSGTVEVMVEPDEGSWTLTGPSGFGTQIGTGDQMFLDSPAGIYSVVFGSLPDYATPIPATQELLLGDQVTFTGTYRPLIDLSGRVYRCGTNGSDAIQNATLTCTPGSGTISSATGLYTFTDLVSGDPYVIDVTRETSAHDASFVTAFDSSLILQDTVGAISLDSCQIDAADVNQDSIVLAYDATLILQYTVGITLQPFPWIFAPPNRSYGTIPPTDLIDQDFEAILKGDVSGNWTPNGAKSRSTIWPPEGSDPPPSLQIEMEETSSDKTMILHVSLSEVEDLQAITNLIVEYDSSVFSLGGPGAVRLGSGLRGFFHVVNPDDETGRIRFSAAGVTPSKGGELLLVSLVPIRTHLRTQTAIRVSLDLLERSDGATIPTNGAEIVFDVLGKLHPEEWDANADGRLNAEDLIALMRRSKTDISNELADSLIFFARYWMQ